MGFPRAKQNLSQSRSSSNDGTLVKRIDIMLNHSPDHVRFVPVFVLIFENKSHVTLKMINVNLLSALSNRNKTQFGI